MSTSMAKAGVFGLGVLAVWACGQGSPAAPKVAARQSHSGPITVSSDGSLLYVAHPDADTVSAIDPVTRAIVFETLLGTAPPAQQTDAMPPVPNGAYYPNVMPRGLALDPTGATLYVTGERSSIVYALDAATGTKKAASTPVCSEPVGILVDEAGDNLFVACSNDDEIAELRTSDLSVVSTVACPRKPFALAWENDGTTLLATHLLGSGTTPTPPGTPPMKTVSDDGGQTGISVFTTAPLALTTSWPIPDVPLCTTGAACLGQSQSDPRVPNGLPRAIYDAVMRPGTDELWVVHAMLASKTPEPTLDFQTTVFPCVSILDSEGDRTALLTVSVADGGPSEGGPGVGGAFGDVVSGPQSITFSPDGRFAFVVDANSEDVLVIDATQQAEAAIVRPLPGHWPVGAVWSPDGKLYVTERNTEDLAVIDVTESKAGADVDASVGSVVSAVVESATIPTLAHDPMPALYRTGQQVFNSANINDMPITQNFWASCASCHIEQRTDAITWQFLTGPRDTPSNAGGMIGTGFLMHTADRRQVSDYWRTIDEEQGGDFSMNAEQAPLLDALEAYVDHAIPVPTPPTTDSNLVTLGKNVFDQAACPTCHRGPWKTDSGCMNPTLDLAGPEVTVCTPGGVLVHEVGTCNTGDLPLPDMNGDPRAACMFDTPALRGLWDSAPYMHDGSAATLDDAVGIMLTAAAKVGGKTDISPSERQALVEYLKSL
jgi:YVTN family beta-propeller protein